MELGENRANLPSLLPSLLVLKESPQELQHFPYFPNLQVALTLGVSSLHILIIIIIQCNILIISCPYLEHPHLPPSGEGSGGRWRGIVTSTPTE